MKSRTGYTCDVKICIQEKKFPKCKIIVVNLINDKERGSLKKFNRGMYYNLHKEMHAGEPGQETCPSCHSTVQFTELLHECEG